MILEQVDKKHEEVRVFLTDSPADKKLNQLHLCWKITDGC